MKLQIKKREKKIKETRSLILVEMNKIDILDTLIKEKPYERKKAQNINIRNKGRSFVVTLKGIKMI